MLPTLPFLLLERYDVIEEIGRGGHAVVFRAHDRSLARDVAVKILREDVLVPDIRARFTQEVQVLAKLQHAHILHVHDSGSFGDRPFVVMELAPAQTLAHRLQREPQLPIADAVQITRDVASALSHAHARAVLHRDVKPENILLGSGGAILADFGIARVTGELAISRITNTGEAVGTLQYMSPEQLCAEQVDGRSDQYALACVLYEMLAGVRPHTAATFEGLRALRLTGRHAPVSVYRPSVSPMLEEVLTRAMAVTAADRYRSMDEFLMALDLTRTGDTAIQSGSFPRVTGGGSTVPAVAAPSVVAPPVSRRRWLLPVALVVVAIGAGAVFKGLSASSDATEGGSTGGASGALTVSLAPASDPLADSVRTRVASELSAWKGVRFESGDDGALRVSVAVTTLSDSVQLRFESRGAGEPFTATRMLARAALPTADATIAALAREVLAGRSASEVPGLEGIPDRSLPALRAYVRGHALLRAGQLDSAAQAFRESRDTLPRFAQARFWAAQSAAWSTPKAVDRWKSDADEAVRISTLRGTDSLLAVGLAHMAAMAFPEACAAYRGVTTREPESFVGWYGLGRCQDLDSLVIIDRDQRRFRSGHWTALLAFKEALARAPTSGLVSRLFAFAERLTYASGNSMRTGISAERKAVFHALPTLEGDSIALHPIPELTFSAGQGSAIPAQLTLALRRGRAVLLEMTEQWTVRFPHSPDAWTRYAEALELVGRIDGSMNGGTITASSALDRVDTDSLDPEGWVRFAVARVRTSLRRGELQIASDSARRFLERYDDSNRRSARASRSLAPLTLMTGDQARFLELTRETVVTDTSVPTPLREPLRRLEAAILFDDCDGARLWADRAEVQLRESVAPALLPSETVRLLGPLYRLGVSCIGTTRLAQLPVLVPLDSVYRLLAKGRQLEAGSLLREVRRKRSAATGSALSWDYLYAEAWALTQVREEASAAALVSGALSDLANVPSSTLSEPAIASGFRRAVLLYAALQTSAADEGRHRKWTEQARALVPPSH